MATENERLAVDRADPNCPVCKTPVRLVDNKADGFCLACATHGRLTERFTTAAAAEGARYITPQEKAASKHTPPLGAKPVPAKGRK